MPGMMVAYYELLHTIPPDSDFTHFARVTPFNRKLFVSARDFAGTRYAAGLAGVTNVLDVYQQLSINVANAEFITANRIDGADAASNTLWSRRQQFYLKALKRWTAGCWRGR